MSAVVEIFPESHALVEAAAARLTDTIVSAVAGRGRALIVLTGGGNGIGLLKALGTQGKIDWSKVHLFWGDERYVPEDDDERNDKQARAALLDHVDIPSSHVHAMPASDGGPPPLGLMEINLMGEVVMDAGRRLTFRRGVSAQPTLGDGVLLADKHDLTRVYAPPQAASIRIGSLFQDNSVPARLLIDDLLSKHFLVVGSTGSGKSSALTCILQRLLAEHAHAHVMILDVHNE